MINSEEAKMIAVVEMREKAYAGMPRVLHGHTRCTDKWCHYYRKENDDRCKQLEARKYAMKSVMRMEALMKRKDAKYLTKKEEELERLEEEAIQSEQCSLS